MKFSVWVPVVGTAFLGLFEAESKEAAIEMAIEQAPGISLCHQCADDIDDPDYDWDRVEAEVSG